MKNSTVKMTRYDYDKKETIELGEVETHLLARCMSLENFVAFISDFVNVGMKDYPAGYAVGKLEQHDHRTLQASLVRFSLGVIIGLSEQDYTDARNEKAVALGKKLAKMLNDGELDMGYMI